MLPREQRRRHDDRGLLAVDRRREGCAQRDLGLAEADVAADQPIHRPARPEIVDRRLDRLRLVLRLVIGEARAEFVVEPLGRNQARGGAGQALRGDAHQLARHLADALLQPRLAGLPARRTQPVEFAVLRAEAREQFQVLDGQEQPVAAGVVNLEAIVRRARRLDRLQADETADAVVDVHDEIARRQRRGLGEHILRAPFPPALPHQPIAENVLLADDGEIGGLEAMLERDHRERQRAGAHPLRLRPGGDELDRFQAVLGEHVAEPLARAVAPARDDDPEPALAQRPDVRGRRLEHVDVLVLPLGSEVAPDPAAAVESLRVRRGLERRQSRERAGREPLAPFVGLEIEPVRLQRPIVGVRRVRFVGGLARGIIIRDQREARVGGLLGARVEHDGRLRDIVEHRVQPLVEQRQPMFEADRAAALAHRLVERIAASRRAEFGGVALAKAADRLGGELRFAHRHEIERAELADAALRLRIERADRFQRVAEEIEPHRGGRAGRPEIENAAALGVIADVAHHRRAREPIGFQPDREIRHAHAVARRRRKSRRRDERLRRDALRHRVDRCDEHARPLHGAARQREPRERGHALRGDRRIGRNAIVGLAVPARQIERLDLRRGEGERVDEALRAQTVARDES